METKFLKSYFIVFILILNIIGITSFFAGSDIIEVDLDNFISGKTSYISFPVGGGSNNSTKLQLPTDATVINATMKLIPAQSYNQYPLNLTIDVGEDGVVEWAFDETGAGPLGYQNIFWDGLENSSVDMMNKKYDLNHGIRLLNDVAVESATIDVWAEGEDLLDSVVELNLRGGGLSGPWDDIHDYDPSLIVFDNKLIDIYRTESNALTSGRDHDLVMNWTEDGITWNENREVTKDPDGAVPWDNNRARWWGMDMRHSAAVYNNRLYVAWESNSTKVGPYPPGVTVVPDDSKGVTSGYDKDIVITSSATGINWSDDVNDFIEITSPFVEDGKSPGKNGYNKENPLPEDWTPKLAVFKNRLYCVWVTNNTGSGPNDYGGYDIMVTWSTDPDNHTGWNNSARVVNLTSNDMWNGSDFYPNLIEFNNKLYCIWQSNDTSNGNLSDYDIYLRYTADGENWSSVIQVSPKGKNDWTAEYLNGSGKYEFWDITPYPIVFNNKLGISWVTKNWRFTKNETWDQIPDDTIDYDIIIAWSDDGVSWDLENGINTFEITPPKNNDHDGYQHLFVFDPDGSGPKAEQLFCAWHSNDLGDVVWDYDILYSYSLDGQNWVPQRVGSTHPDNGGGDYWARLGGFKGSVYLTWWSFDDKDGSAGGVNNDGDDADVLVRRITPSFLPLVNISIDVGNDGVKEFGPAQLDFKAKTVDVKNALNNALAQASTSHIDKYGNKFTDIVINVSSPDDKCNLWLENINISYSRAGENFFIHTPDFSKALNDYIASHQSDKDALDKIFDIPILFASTSAGKLTVTDLNITYKINVSSPPSIIILRPSVLNDIAVYDYWIHWADADIDSSAKISLYFDDNLNPSDGKTLIVANLDEDSVVDKFHWLISDAVAHGRYYIYGEINDGISIYYDYSDGFVDIVPQYIEKPDRLGIEQNIDPSGNRLETHALNPTLTWENSPYNPEPNSTNLIEYSYIINVGTSASSKDDILKNYETESANITLNDDLIIFDGSYFFEILVTDGRDHYSEPNSTFLYIVNRHPGAPVISIHPKEPTTKDQLILQILNQSIDPDGDTIDYDISWFKSDVQQVDYDGFSKVEPIDTNKNEIWKVVVTPYDEINGVRQVDGTSSKYSVQIRNSAPEIQITLPLNNSVFRKGETISFKGKASDPDGGDKEKLTFQWLSDIDGPLSSTMAFETSGLSVGNHNITFKVFDGESESFASIKLRIERFDSPVTDAKIVVDKTTIYVGETVKFNGNASDPDGDILKFTWDFGDGSIGGSGQQIEQIYTQAGEFIVTLNVTDTDNTYNTVNKKIVVLNKPDDDSKDEAKKTGEDTTMIILAMIILIVIALLALMLLIRRKKKVHEPYPPIPEQPIPEQPIPEQPIPEQPVPEQPVPEQPVPEQPVPEQPMPEQPDSSDENLQSTKKHSLEEIERNGDVSEN